MGEHPLIVFQLFFIVLSFVWKVKLLASTWILGNTLEFFYVKWVKKIFIT